MESETIKFNEADGKDGFLIKEDSAIIHIFPSRSSQKVSNSKVKLTNVVNYAWDAQHGIGRLIAPHYSGKFIAYCIKVANVGAVRVVDLDTQERVLMKGTRGLIKDVEFMHKSDEMVLGFIDEYGSFYIYKILKEVKTGKMQTVLIFQVSLEGSPSRLDCRRFIWCKFVPDELNDIATPRDYAYHFAVCEDDMVYVANLVQLVQKFGEGIHTLQSLKGHYMTIDAHAGSVVDASFSPDGTALATASKDGTVKFFQVYLVGEETPRCLYSWPPHEGAPVSKMFFLDDHTLNNPTESQYWKYMITAGANMSELKLWTCKTWECLQTIKFCCPSPSTLKMDLNINAKFLVLSDIHRKVMFVLNLEHDDDGARFCWINEFSLPVNMIGFNIREAYFATNRQIAEKGFEHFVSSSDTDDAYACIVDVIFVQPKSLMQAAVAFRPPTGSSPPNGRSHSRISFDDSVSFKDDEEDSKLEVEDEDEDENMEPEQAVPVETRSPRSTSRSPSRIPTPVSASSARLGSKSPSRRSPSPRSPLQGVCVSQMTQQLNSLMGVGVGFGNNLTGSLSTGHVEVATGHSPFHGMNVGSESTTGPIRIRTSSDNGNVSNASSSPSREVEEILSPKNNEAIIHNKLDTSYNSMEATYAVNNLDVEGNILHANDLPLLTSPKSFQRLPIKTKSLGGGELGSPQLPQVLEQVNSIMDMMKTQAQEMQELKREVSRLNNAQNSASRQLDESGMSRVMDKYFGHNQSCLQRLEDTITNVFTVERQQSATQIPPNLVENVSATVGNAVKTEIETRVLPQLVKVFEPAKHQIHNDIEKLVKAAEARVKQQISHVFNGQDFRNHLVPELAASLKSVCDGAITQVFTTSVVPNFEKALQNIFLKVNDTFMAGTKEYLGALEASLNSGRLQSENSQEVIREQLSSMQDNLSSILQVELETHMMQVLGSLQGGVVKKIEESMSKELSRAFRDQQRYFEISVIPRTVTPAVSVCDQTASPAVDPATLQRQVLAMLESGDITGAFVKATNCADTNLLMLIASRVRPSEVFTRSLPTSAHLSIIQQMATDLMSHTETKLAYLQTAMGAINISDPKVLKSMSRIIPVFHASVKNFIGAKPDSPLVGSIKLLEMAFAGIGNTLRQQQVTPNAREDRLSSAQLLHSQHQHHHYMD